MHEVVLEIPAAALEEVLDGLLPIVPGGVRERRRGARVELRMRGAELPTVEELGSLLRRWAHRIEERQVADDWRERRLADYEPDRIGGRLIVRPEWAPAPADQGTLEVVLSESAAFGVGAHPTTRTCLELLLELEPRGSFVDLGCGTGVLAIAAAKLGWSPVVALDVQPESVAAACANAEANGVQITAITSDLGASAPPSGAGIAANVPAWLHARIGSALPDPGVEVLLVSGFVRAEASDALGAYLARGFETRREVDAHGWVVAVLERS